MYSFASEYNFIVPFQYGFQSGLSTSDALLEYANEAYKTFNNREINCTAFLDFRKALDCVDVDILLMKLDHMGFRASLMIMIFLLYVNDMYRSAPDLSFIHYADDKSKRFHFSPIILPQ